MKAAVVSSFDTPPRLEEIPEPRPEGPDELVVTVVAAGLHPRARSQADGSHYTSDAVLPLIPGIDGVGRDPSGRLRYFVLPDSRLGSFAERTVIDARRSIVLPGTADAVAIAAAMNPAMSSWLALRRRIAFEAGMSVLVLGATGSAGRLAVQVAHHAGASRIVGAGRDRTRLSELPALGACETVSLDGDDEAAAERLATAAADVDVVLDYLWGTPTASAMAAIVAARADRAAELTWVQLGSVAGRTAPIPSAALRAARLQVVGSGQGSVPTRDILAELPELAERITAGDFVIGARAVALADLAAVWDAASADRVVFTP